MHASSYNNIKHGPSYVEHLLICLLLTLLVMVFPHSRHTRFAKRGVYKYNALASTTISLCCKNVVADSHLATVPASSRH